VTRPAPANPIRIATAEEARALEGRIRASAAAAAAALADLLAADDPLETFRAMKFRRVGFHPLDPERSLNLLEQVHSTFAWLTAVRGVEHLIEHHPSHGPFTLDLSRSQGPDIVSADGRMEAEVCALVSAAGNRKLEADIERMRASTVEHRYVFYHAEEDAGSVSDPVVHVVSITL
jgi:hypothetical protein